MLAGLFAAALKACCGEPSKMVRMVTYGYAPQRELNTPMVSDMAKTVGERQRELKERMAADGLKEIRSLYAHPDDFKQIRAYVAKLNKARCKAR